MAIDQTKKTVLRFERVAMRYPGGIDVLRDIDLDLEAGAFRFVTGASGAGKSSLLRLIFLAERPSRGRITLFGRDRAAIMRDDLPAVRRRIGVIFQDYRLLQHLTAFDNVALPLRIAGTDETRIRSEVEDLMRWVGLADRLHARPSTMSGGEQQRVAIARAVVTRPDLLVADEPTGNVDDEIAHRLLLLFEELNRQGTTVVIATHNEGLVAGSGHPVLHIQGGRVVERPGTRRTDPEAGPDTGPDAGPRASGSHAAGLLGWGGTADAFAAS